MKVVVHKTSCQVGEEVEFWRSEEKVMNFGIKVKNLGRNWEAETGTVATTDLEKFPRSQLVAKNYEIYWV